jgi:hypothetical protein
MRRNLRTSTTLRHVFIEHKPHSQNKSQIHKGIPHGSKIDTIKMVHNQTREWLIQQDPSHVHSSINKIVPTLYFKITILLFRP